MDYNLIKLKEAIEDAQFQADMLPWYEKPRGTREWLVNNQRRYIHAAIERALLILDDMKGS